MENNNLEVMEMEPVVDVIEMGPEGTEESGFGKSVAFGAAVIAGVGALGALAYNKLKAKKDDKPKKKKKKLMWVEVEDEPVKEKAPETEEVEPEEPTEEKK